MSRSTLLDRLLLLVIFTTALFFCFFNLGAKSIDHWDEGTHISVTQNMYQGGHFLTPMLEGKTYFHKPPFKMWLSALTMSVLPESNFSWRLLDAFAGVSTVLLVYFFGIQLFENRFAAAIGAISLLGFRGFLFEHNVRMAVQDSMLTFLQVLCVYAGCIALRLHNSAREQTPHMLRWTLLSGFAFGASLLTKSVFGFLAPAILGLTALLHGRAVTRHFILHFLTLFALGIAMAAAYFAPHALWTPGAWEMMFGFEVVGRLQGGYHNADRWWLYLDYLFRRQFTLHPAVIGAGLIVALYSAIRYRDSRYTMILSWIVPPLFALSLATSRVPQYMNSLYPAFALIVTLLAACILSFSKSTHQLARISLPVGILLILVAISANLSRNASWIMRTEERLGMDLMHDGLRSIWPRVPDSSSENQLQFFSYKVPRMIRENPWDLPYFRSFQSHGTSSADIMSVGKAIKSGKPVVVLTTYGNVSEFFQFGVPDSFLEIAPFTFRTRPLVALLFNHKEVPKHFSPNKVIIKLGEKSAPVQFGWSHAGTFGELKIRNSVAEKASLLLSTGKLFQLRPTHLYLNLTSRHKTLSKVKLKIHVNDTFIEEIELKNNSLKTYDLPIPAGVFIPGKNSLLLTPEDNSPLLANWISLQLR